MSCQKEAEEFIDETKEEETITLNSVLTGKLLSASQNNGYKDNIIDGSNCISVEIPVTIVANKQEVVIQTEDDYALVQAIFDEYSNDIDSIEFEFPITVVFEQYNTIQVNNKTVFNSIIDACQNTIVDTYTCVDFIYPISCFTFNETSEQTGFITLNNNPDWFAYLNYLQDDIFIAIDYPMGVVVDNQVTVVNDNSALFEIMYQTNCDAEIGLINLVDFENKLTTAIWYVNLYNEDGSNQTCAYVAYEFLFREDGTVQAAGDFDVRNGVWELLTEGDNLYLDLEFESNGSNDPFEALMTRWNVLESTVQNIKLKDNNNGNGTFDYLYFGRTATISCGSGNGQILKSNLIDGVWSVESYSNNGNNETGNFKIYELNFEIGGAVVATGGIYNYYGSWDVIGSDELEIALDFGIQFPFSEFNANWDVLAFDANRVELHNKIGGTNTLILEKL
ncbi:MAG: hypothetical protein JKY22_05500 [Flavobacteriaceae bacterium]|nr:hypothetical protein [Flavobacteriaceae bacterium]